MNITTIITYEHHKFTFLYVLGNVLYLGRYFSYNGLTVYENPKSCRFHYFIEFFYGLMFLLIDLQRYLVLKLYIREFPVFDTSPHVMR